MSRSFRKLVESGSIWKLCVAGAALPLAAVASQVWIQAKLAQQPYYTEAIRLINEYKTLDDYLGEPWETQWVSRGIMSNTRIGVDNVSLDIPVKGRKDKGTVHVTAAQVDGRWAVDKMEIKLNKARKKWIFYKAEANSSLEGDIQLVER